MLFKHDLSLPAFNDILNSRDHIAIDTETTGLDYRKDSLQLVQLNYENLTHLVQFPDRKSKYLKQVLSLNRTKIFHFAQFDLAFLCAGTGILPAPPIECTKTLMKMIYPQHNSGLAASLREILEVHIKKEEAAKLSQWKGHLTTQQIQYATEDIKYLRRLHTSLINRLSPNQQDDYLIAMDTIYRKVYLELRGYTDLLQYEKEDLKTTIQNRNWWIRKKLEWSDG